MNNNNKGFTLVELSIVLVIIGLLIGGILVAQSLITGAKIQQQIRQIQQIEIAVNNFQTNYKSLPGDSSRVGLTTGSAIPGQPQTICAGNGDGRIETNVTTPSATSLWQSSGNTNCDPTVGNNSEEYVRVFKHLSTTGMYDWELYNETSNTNFVAGVAFPQMILDSYEPKSLGIIGGVTVGWETGLSYLQEGHKIRLGSCYGNASTPIAGGGPRTGYYCGPSLPDMAALDQKLDDGRPMTGDVVATSNYYVYNISGGLGTDGTGCCINQGTNTYLTEPTNTLVSTGNYIALEINTDF